MAGRAGVTVSAMASVSAEGPTLLVCVHHKSPAAAAILENGVFCVNVLRDDQSHVADTFAGRLPPGEGGKFACAEWIGGVTGDTLGATTQLAEAAALVALVALA